MQSAPKAWGVIALDLELRRFVAKKRSKDIKCENCGLEIFNAF